MEGEKARCIRKARGKRRCFQGGLGVASGLPTCCRQSHCRSFAAMPMELPLLFTDPGASHQDSGATWRWSRGPSVHSSHLGLGTA